MMEHSAKLNYKFDEEEILDYYDVFWNQERYKEIEDWHKFMKNIEKGEEKIQKKINTRLALKEKVNSYYCPFVQLKLVYNNVSKQSGAMGRAWSEQEDRFMVCMMEKIGLDRPTVFEEIKKALRMAPQFRFDWFIKSRTTTEIMKRCQYLLLVLEKEFTIAAQKENKENGGLELNGGGKRKADEAKLSGNKNPSKILKSK